MSPSRAAAATLLVLLAAPRSGAAQDLPVDPAVRTARLPNGVTYFVRANAEPRNRAELRLVVNAGSVLEDDDQRGLAHVVEHLAFNGTRRFPKQTLVDFLERIGMRFGAHVNAYTSHDETVYLLQVPTDDAGVLARSLDILEDWAGGLAFDPAEVEAERGVVIEEWRLGLGADERLQKKHMPVLLRGSRYTERSPIGDLATLRSFDRERLVRFYRDWYRPDLMAVVAVGDFDADSMEAMIRSRFGALPRPAAPRPRPVVPVPTADSLAVTVATDPENPISRTGLSIRVPSREQGTVDDYRRSLVEALGDGMLGDRLDEVVRRPNPPFAGAFVSRQSWVRTADFVTLWAGVGDGGITRGLEGLLTEAERVRRHGFTATELARARDELRRAYERAHAERDKTPSAAYAGEYTRHFLEGEPIPGIEVEYRLVQALLPGITLAEVDSAARAWLERSDRVLLADAPDKPGLTPPDEADLRAVLGRVSAARVAAYEDAVDDEPLVPDPPAPGRVVAETQDARLGTVAWTLSNGARVIVRPTDFKADEVLMSGFSPGGHSLAPDSLFLNAWLAADLARLGGVGAFDAVALQKKLAGRLVRVGSYVGITQEGVSASGSPQDLETMLQLTWLGFTAPRADTAAFQAFLANARAAMANRGAIPEQAFSDTVQVTLAEHHPRVRPVTPAILDSLDLGRALAFYRDRFADASDFTFVFVGAVDPDSLRPLAARWLGSLPALRRGERWRDPGIRPPRGVVERTVRKGVEPKAYTQIVFAGDWQDARANRAAIRGLARALEIQLRDELREALGATYSVGVSASTFREPHPSYSLSIQFGSAPERVDALAREVFAIVDAMRAGGPRPADLAKVVEAEVRARETALRQNGYWLNGLVFLAQTGEDPAGLLDPRGDADLMTAGAIRAAARRYLDPARHVRVTLLPEEGAVP